MGEARVRAYDWLKDHGELPKAFDRDYGINVLRKNLPVDVARSFRCDVPGVSTLFAVVANDAFIPSDRLQERLPEGVTFMSLSQANRECPELLKPYYAKVAPETDPEVALNTMLVQDGVFLHIAAGVRVEKPLQLVNIFSSPIDLLAFRRLLIVMEADSEARILVCDHTQDTDRHYLSSQVAEIVMKPGSRLDACTIEESSLLTGRRGCMYSTLEHGANMAYTSATLTCGDSDNLYHISLDGERAEARISGMAIASETMNASMRTHVAHNVPRCKSDQLVKYVLSDEAHGSFKGKILVTPNAPFTEAYQSDRNLLASEGARMHAEPALEIYNDEVKCSHEAATGQMDEKALFYMRSRGIPLAQARIMLMQAFMSDVVDTVRIPGLQDRLRHLVNRRFSGEAGSCENCRNV